MPPPRPTRYKDVSPDAAVMLSAGESAGCEYKQTAKNLKAKVFVALANWVAMDESREAAHLFVGVQEVQDPSTGLNFGEPCGLEATLEIEVHRLQDFIRDTRPIPVDTVIIEENVEGSHPFIRIEIRPTAAPHYDDEGRRLTRQGKSTRGMTGDELLQMYLARESSSFAVRFRQAGEELKAAVSGVENQVDEIAETIEVKIAEPVRELTMLAHAATSAASSAQSSASSAEAASMSTDYEVSELKRTVEELQELVDEVQSVPLLLARKREVVWIKFSSDTWRFRSQRAGKVAEALQTLLSRGIPIDAGLGRWELDVWENLLHERAQQNEGRGTLKWWETETAETTAYFQRPPSYIAWELPDLRTELWEEADAIRSGRNLPG